ncbi:MAG: LacI family DNA-binding transcriptional regulator [Oscillospiraceae bacterium]|nr:LacI family DNA-binding transcriptional regulator [Oscillospiraceae bacterium]
MNITEIAKLAGVSKAAVSRYFNGGYLSAEKSEAVRRVVEQTGYEPNVQAQMLRRQRTRQIGVVLPKLSSESCARVTDGISSVLSGYGYQLMLANTANDPSKEIAYLDLLRRHHVEGVIFLASIFTPEHDSVLKNMHIPVVIVGQRHAGYNCVYHDDRGAAEAVTSLMLRHGCRRPGYIRGHGKRPRRRLRAAAGLSAGAESGRPACARALYENGCVQYGCRL